jgi:hypothetical protein
MRRCIGRLFASCAFCRTKRDAEDFFVNLKVEILIQNKHTAQFVCGVISASLRA